MTENSENEKRKNRMLYLDSTKSDAKQSIPRQTRSRWKKLRSASKGSNPEPSTSSCSSEGPPRELYTEIYPTSNGNNSEDYQDFEKAYQDVKNKPEKKSTVSTDMDLEQNTFAEENNTSAEEDNDEEHYNEEENDEDIIEEENYEEEFNDPSEPYEPNKEEQPFTPQEGIDTSEHHLNFRFIAMLLGLKVKHSLTNVCVTDICKFVNLIKGEPFLPPTYHQFKVSLKNYQSPVQIHNVCPDCNKYIGQHDNNSTLLCVCGTEISIKNNISKGHFFLHLPLESQIRNIIQNNTINSTIRFVNKERQICTNIKDIHDGEMFRRKMHDIQRGMSSDQDVLTLNVNTDGIPVFPSSNFSVWPVLCSVNNLPPLLRKKYILLSSLWFGDSKPNMNEFLKPFVEDVNKLSEDGLSYKRSDNTVGTCHVYCMTVICDSVARPTVQNMIQFNGKFGCSYCLNPGEVIAKGHGFSRIYPKKLVQARNHEEWLELSVEAEANKSVLQGIKGRALILDVMTIDMVHSFSPDYNMHSVLLGVVRQFFKLWFDSKFHQMPWYIGTRQEEVDQRLLEIKPPYILSRTPRSLKTHKYWKAHEWCNWLIYYSVVVLKGILPKDYLLHWCFLVNSIYTLLQESVSKSEIHMAQNALDYFQAKTEDLYGKEHLTYNLHLCTHIATSVRNWGPLWAHSGFIFENYNGVLLEMVKSSKGVPHQIMSSFQDQQVLHLFNQITTPDAGFLHQKSKACAMKVSYQSANVNESTLLGVGVKAEISDCYRLAIVSLSGLSLPQKEVVTYYDRVIVNNILIYISSYSKVTKRNSYTVLLDSKEFFQIERFVVVESCCFAVGYYFNKLNSPILFNLPPTVPLNHIVSGIFSSSVAAIEVKSIAKVTVFVNDGVTEQTYVCLPPNHYGVSM